MGNNRFKDRPLHTSVSSFNGVSRLLVQSEALREKTHLVLRSVLDVTRSHMLHHGAEEEGGRRLLGRHDGWRHRARHNRGAVRWCIELRRGARKPESAGLLYAHLHARGVLSPPRTGSPSSVRVPFIRRQRRSPFSRARFSFGRSPLLRRTARSTTFRRGRCSSKSAMRLGASFRSKRSEHVFTFSTRTSSSHDLKHRLRAASG